MQTYNAPFPRDALWHGEYYPKHSPLEWKQVWIGGKNVEFRIVHVVDPRK